MEDCANGEDETYEQQESVDVYVYMNDASESNMNFDYEVYGMDYEENYEISWTVTDDEGTTSDAGSTAITDGSYSTYETADAEIDGFGEYCVDIEVTRISDSEVVGTEQECESVSQEIEPSDRLITIVDALAESTIDMLHMRTEWLTPCTMMQPTDSLVCNWLHPQAALSGTH